MQHSRGLVRVASSVVVLGLLVLAAGGCGDKSNSQSNEGVVCNKGERGCDGSVMSVCNPSQSGWKTYKCASEDSCLKGIPYSMCAELVGDAGVSDCASVAPMADCNSNMSLDGCETNTAISVKHCGACGNECGSTNGTPRCVAGQCFVDCKKGYADCNADPIDGCEVSTDSDISNCGQCGDRCPETNGKAICSAGACTISTCSPGYADCNGAISDACEAVTLTDPKNCGGCAKACSNAYGTTACTAGICVPTCAAGYADCDGNPANGCEADMRSTPTSCGGCGKICEGGARAVCISGICDLACEAGKGDCDRDSSNGCEADTLANPLNCGVCGRACANAHGTTTCTAGACVPTCTSGHADCDGIAANGCETATDTSLDNCGACGKACSGANGTAVCSSGSCSVTCTANYANCDGSVANGCEAYLLGDPKHCGACGRACVSTGGTATCSASICGLTCDANHGDCDANLANGCEVSTAADVNNCGGCNKLCSGANATAHCDAGACKLTCDIGYRDCNANAADGCEAGLASDAKNCGKCGRSCGNGTCKEGLCQPWVVTMGYSRPTRMQITSEAIYWINEGVSTNDGAVMRLDHGATTPVALASAQAKPAGLAVAESVFWTNGGDGTVKQVAKTGGTAFVLASGGSLLTKICATSERVVWSQSTGLSNRSLVDDSVSQLSTSTAADLKCVGSEVYASGVYLTGESGATLVKFQLLGGAQSTLGKSCQVGKNNITQCYPMGSLTIQDSSVCWVAVPTGTGYSFAVWCAHAGGASTLTDYIGVSAQIASDASHLYWYSGTNLIRGPISGGITEILGTVSNPIDLAVYGDAVYWTEPENGRIMAIAKP